MEKLFNELLNIAILSNEKGDKVEQKQSRFIKSKVMKDFQNTIEMLGYTIEYDVKNKPVIVFENGLLLSFDFVVRNLDTELYDEPTKE